MGASITAIKTGLKDALNVFDGVRCYATQPAKPEPPALTVLGPVSWRYDQTMGLDGERLAIYTFEVGIYVNPASDITRAQTQLDAFLADSGSRSIHAAIEAARVADGPLAGIADDAHVIGGNAYARLVDVAGTQLLYASVTVEVQAS